MKDSIIVKFNGGLGNQLFQWAFGTALAKRTGKKVLFDMSFFKKNYSRPYELGIFDFKIDKVEGFFNNLKLNLIWKFRKKFNEKYFLGTYIYEEPHFEFDEKLFNIKEPTYIHGFFQSEKYFKDAEDEIRALVKFLPEPSDENKEIIEKINSSNSVSIHVRRGDYVQKKRYQERYATCSLDYYRRGIDFIAQKVENPTIFVFSDDKEWVKENLKLPFECIYVDNNSGEKSFEDMRLMSLCKHNIIANSSFSWWGAWLNNNKQKIVIAPKKWFNDEKVIQKDVNPDDWIILEN